MIKKILISLVVLASTFLVAPPALAVEVIDPVCDSPGSQASSAVCKDNNSAGGRGQDDLIFGRNGIVARVLNILSVIVGFAAIIVILISSIRIITSNGDSNTVGSARNAIIFAVVGLVIVSVAQIIVRFVLSRIS